MFSLGMAYILSCVYEGDSCKKFYLPSEKRSTLQGKNTLQGKGSKFFPFRADPFQNGLGVQKQAGSHKSCLPC